MKKENKPVECNFCKQEPTLASIEGTGWRFYFCKVCFAKAGVALSTAKALLLWNEEQLKLKKKPVKYFRQRDEDIEHWLLTEGEAFEIVLYAEEILKKPWPVAERRIIEHGDLHDILMYAEVVLRGPFKAAEARISKGGFDSFLYARYCLQGPFEAGEPAIISDCSSSELLEYATMFKKGRWIEAEHKLFPSASGAAYFKFLLFKGFKKEDVLTPDVAELLLKGYLEYV